MGPSDELRGTIVHIFLVVMVGTKVVLAGLSLAADPSFTYGWTSGHGGIFLA